VTAQFGAALAEALPRLRRYAIALAGDVSTADDLLQDCMERAWRNRTAITNEKAIFPWLRTILHNVNIDRIRLRRRRPNEAETLDSISETLASAAASDGPALSMDVVRAMKRLSIEHRQILLLSGVEGLSYREIAAELSVPSGTVMSRLARARERLRALLEEGL
jgi:RNA polymerase sigma-70 factor (ECF subfamily)